VGLRARSLTGAFAEAYPPAVASRYHVESAPEVRIPLAEFWAQPQERRLDHILPSRGTWADGVRNASDASRSAAGTEIRPRLT